MKALQEFLRPEFLNRVDEVVYFHQLTEENFRAIAALMLGELRDSLAEKGLTLSWEDSLLDYLVKKSYSASTAPETCAGWSRRSWRTPLPHGSSTAGSTP